MGGVGRAYAIVTGRLTGDREEASQYLGSMFREQLRAVNRQESRKPKKATKPGRKPK